MTGLASVTDGTCLLGATGFVGSALLRQTQFDACFNSRTIGDIEGGEFSHLVCAAAPGSMLEANTVPERDRALMSELMERLSKVKAHRFTLISSIAVLSNFAGQDTENTNSFQVDLAYGRHRRELEVFVEEHFDQSLIVRLPALFGHGLRKNFIFDLLNPVPSLLTREKLMGLREGLPVGLSDWVGELFGEDSSLGLLKLNREALNADPRRRILDCAVDELGASATQFHNRETTYQYYEIDRLWRDIDIATKAGLSYLHLASEPVQAKEIYKRLAGREMPQTNARLHEEDMHSAHGALWDREGPYLFGAETVLERLETFFDSEKAAKDGAAA
ncbi:MAG: hypothetical protein ABJK59_06145 [Erythrobacter sp.]|uniref:hypothetical protein n=1 Tax=Erythrobacter sp. TaxID=1042 RepID=UPI003299F68E